MSNTKTKERQRVADKMEHTFDRKIKRFLEINEIYLEPEYTCGEVIKPCGDVSAKTRVHFPTHETANDAPEAYVAGALIIAATQFTKYYATLKAPLNSLEEMDLDKALIQNELKKRVESSEKSAWRKLNKLAKEKGFGNALWYYGKWASRTAKPFPSLFEIALNDKDWELIFSHDCSRYLQLWLWKFDGIVLNSKDENVASKIWDIAFNDDFLKYIREESSEIFVVLMNKIIVPRATGKWQNKRAEHYFAHFWLLNQYWSKRPIKIAEEWKKSRESFIGMDLNLIQKAVSRELAGFLDPGKR